MSETTRRRSRTMRLLLVAVALLGIGATITAAAWQDDVYVELDVATGSMDLEGQVITDGAASGWLDSDDENSIELAVVLNPLTPGDEHEVNVALRNNGTMTAYVTLDGSGLTLDPSALGDCALDGTGSDAIPGAFSIPANGGEVDWTLQVAAPADWGDECQGIQLVSGSVVFHATTDAPTP